jgi:hypothetical protein
LLVLEDAHWCDPTTLELFDRVVERVAALPVLLVVTFPPRVQAALGVHAASNAGRASSRVRPAASVSSPQSLCSSGWYQRSPLSATTARERGARSFELRAAIRLARLDREAGERQRARDLLAPIYGWFTEGFDTPNLIEAKALLDELS